MPEQDKGAVIRPNATGSENSNANLRPRDAAALLLIGIGAIGVIAVDARGYPTAVAWLAMFGGLVLGLSDKSKVVRFGGGLILSLVLLVVIAAIVRRGEPDSSSRVDAERAAQVERGAVAPTKYVAASSAPEPTSPEAVAQSLGGGPDEAERIRRIAEFYDVEPKLVAAQAANTARLCLDGEDIEAKPTEAMRFAAAGLAYVDKVTRDTAREMDAKSVRELLPLSDAWVTYVSMGCPQ